MSLLTALILCLAAFIAVLNAAPNEKPSEYKKDSKQSFHNGEQSLRLVDQMCHRYRLSWNNDPSLFSDDRVNHLNGGVSFQTPAAKLYRNVCSASTHRSPTY